LSRTLVTLKRAINCSTLVTISDELVSSSAWLNLKDTNS